MTLITGIIGTHGLILAADSEEQISQPNALRTRADNFQIFNGQQPTPWTVALTGSGDSDWIGMAKDFIEEAIRATDGTDKQIIDCIRKAIHEIWRDYIQYERGQVDLGLLIGSFSSDFRLRFTVVKNTAVRTGRSLEAMGIGDSVFRSLADRYLDYGTLGHVPGDMEVLRYFVIHAMQQAKSVPGVGGNTRVLTIGRNGEIKWEKSYKIWEVTRFLGNLENDLRLLISQDVNKGEEFIKELSQGTVKRLRAFRSELERIESDSSLL